MSVPLQGARDTTWSPKEKSWGDWEVPYTWMRLSLWRARVGSNHRTESSVVTAWRDSHLQVGTSQSRLRGQLSLPGTPKERSTHKRHDDRKQNTILWLDGVFDEEPCRVLVCWSPRSMGPWRGSPLSEVQAFIFLQLLAGLLVGRDQK